MVRANARAALAHPGLPAVNAFFAARGGRLSPHKTILPPRAQGCACLGQTGRNHVRPHGPPAKLQMPPSKARVPARTAKITTLWRHAAGATPAPRSDPLHPLLSGGAHDHRHSLWRATLAHRARCVWRRRYRWATRRHPPTTGRWSTERSVPHQPGASWRCPDPTTGPQRLRLPAAGKPPRPMKVKSAANPCAPHWEASLQERERQGALKTPAAVRAQLLQPQTGQGPIGRQLLQCEEPRALQHRDGVHPHNRREHLVLLPPHWHRQGHCAPDSTTTTPRPPRDVGHA